jgi:hypothetical protein
VNAGSRAPAPDPELEEIFARQEVSEPAENYSGAHDAIDRAVRIAHHAGLSDAAIRECLAHAIVRLHGQPVPRAPHSPEYDTDAE